MEVLKDIDTSLVTVGSPTDGGCVYVCLDGKKDVPTDATTKMSELEGFLSVGEISENGFTEAKEITNNEFSGWHGTTVLAEVQSERYTYKLEFLEVSRPVVAQMRYGIGSTTANEDGSISKVDPIIGKKITVPLVIDELESNGYLRRTVVPQATINSFDDVQHQKGALMVYGCTFTAIDPGDGHPFHIYRAKPASTIAAAQGVAVAKK